MPFVPSAAKPPAQNHAQGQTPASTLQTRQGIAAASRARALHFHLSANLLVLKKKKKKQIGKLFLLKGKVVIDMSFFFPAKK